MTVVPLVKSINRSGSPSERGPHIMTRYELPRNRVCLRGPWDANQRLQLLTSLSSSTHSILVSTDEKRPSLHFRWDLLLDHMRSFNLDHIFTLGYASTHSNEHISQKSHSEVDMQLRLNSLIWSHTWNPTQISSSKNKSYSLWSSVFLRIII